jgi:hypothetical protein
VYIRFTQPIPAKLRLIIGDCLHHPPLHPRRSRL